MKIIPLKMPISARVQMVGSKSYTNRALIMAALTQGSVCLKYPLYSEDTEAMLSCLRALGLSIETHSDQIIVHGDVSNIEEKHYTLYARDSGTTARFMLALACIVPGVKRIEGSKRLSERPISDLVDALRQLGAGIVYEKREGELPVTVMTSTLSNNTVHLSGAVSSQFCSALFLIAPYLPQGLTIYITGTLVSKPYVVMTVGCMRDWGVTVVQAGGSYYIPGAQPYHQKEYTIEGDFSSAGYFFAVAALTQSRVTVENLNPASLQADRKFLEILVKMGATLQYGQNSVCVQGKELLALEVDMQECPDQVMTLAVLAAFVQGVTHISGVRSLRVKETERVVALRNELRKMGVPTKDTHDTLTIYGGAPQPAEIETYNDHRMAMAFAVAGTRLPGMVIRHPEVVGKTFPSFWEVLGRLQ